MKRFTTHLAMSALAGCAVLALTAGVAQALQPPGAASRVITVATGIQGASGSTVGPDGALYVTESDTGRILRIEPHNGATSVFASGLPTKVAPIGGPMDVVFQGNTAYVLVSLVGPFFGTDDASGIYRVDGPSEFTLIADLGAWAIAHPPGPDLDYFITTGVHYAIDNYQGGFVVTDGHHNKVIRVSNSGAISELATLSNVVPAGIDAGGPSVLVAETGPNPHLAADGRIVRVDGGSAVTPIASGGPLMIDVARGQGGTILGLAQGHFTPGQDDGSPADPNTGELVVVDGAGGVTVLATGLDRPTSLDVIGTSAYVVGMGGTVVRVEGVAGPSPSPVVQAPAAAAATTGTTGGGEAANLAFSGSQSAMLAAVGFALVGAGSAAMAVRRRRY